VARFSSDDFMGLAPSQLLSDANVTLFASAKLGGANCEPPQYNVREEVLLKLQSVAVLPRGEWSP
jgi:hypothetical protein